MERIANAQGVLGKKDKAQLGTQNHQYCLWGRKGIGRTDGPVVEDTKKVSPGPEGRI